jgi:hypothetical protein
MEPPPAHTAVDLGVITVASSNEALTHSALIVTLAAAKVTVTLESGATASVGPTIAASFISPASLVAAPSRPRSV